MKADSFADRHVGRHCDWFCEEINKKAHKMVGLCKMLNDTHYIAAQAVVGRLPG